MGTLIEYVSLSDLDLVNKYKEGRDKNFVGVLYQRYAGLMLGTCIKYLKDEDQAQDAVMDIFEQLFEKLLLHEVANFKSWLYSVTRFHCLQILRKNKPFQFEDVDSEKIEAQLMEKPDFEHLKEEERSEEEILKEAIGELSTEQRVCVSEFYLNKKSYQEVSDLTGYDLKKVKSYIQNGKRNLRILLEKNSSFAPNQTKTNA